MTRTLNAPGPLPTGHGGWCPDCRMAWTEKQAAHCAGCCRQFSSDSAFDTHLSLDADTGKSVCRDPAAVKTRTGRAKLVDRGGVWGAPGPEGGRPWVTDPRRNTPAAVIDPPVIRERGLFDLAPEMGS